MASIFSQTSNPGASQLQSNSIVANAQSQQLFGLATNGSNGVGAIQNYYGNLMQGGPALTEAESGNIANTEAQFAAAQQSLMNSSVARGGGLTQGIANLDAGKAQTISNLLSGAQSGAVQNLGNLDLGLLSGSSSLLNSANSAASASSTANLQQQQLTAQGFGGIGALIGALLTAPGNTGSILSGI